MRWKYHWQPIYQAGNPRHMLDKHFSGSPCVQRDAQDPSFLTMKLHHLKADRPHFMISRMIKLSMKPTFSPASKLELRYLIFS